MCDTLVTITDDGVLFAKNSDRDPNEAQLLEWHPATATSSGVLISRPWWLRGAEMGANEHGVTIGNEAVFTRRTKKSGGDLTGMDLLRSALEQSTDRYAAVQVIVTLLEAHGQGGQASFEHPRFHYDNSFIVADRSGAIVLETAGRSYATEEVTGARSISNGLTIPGFADKHADLLRGHVAECGSRRQRTTATARSATTVLDLMAGLREHGDGERITYRLANGALSAPCAHAGGLLTSTQSTASWIADVTAMRHWATATSAPCTSVFKPVPLGPLPLQEPADATNRYDPRFLWWRHEQVHRAWVREPAAFGGAALERDELERSWFIDGFDPTEAWTQAAAWESRASRVVVRSDERPPLVRALWRRWDAAAGLARDGVLTA